MARKKDLYVFTLDEVKAGFDFAAIGIDDPMEVHEFMMARAVGNGQPSARFGVGTCPDCGSEFTRRSPNQKRCDACAPAHRKEKRREQSKRYYVRRKESAGNAGNAS